jgi:hypothetical protein
MSRTANTEESNAAAMRELAARKHAPLHAQFRSVETGQMDSERASLPTTEQAASQPERLPSSEELNSVALRALLARRLTTHSDAGNCNCRVCFFQVDQPRYWTGGREVAP